MRISDWSSDVCSSDLLYTAFNSIKYAALILANVPFATIGDLLALFVTGQYLSVPSAIGFIAVFGVAMLNGIVLVSFLNELRDKGLSVRDSVVQRSAERRVGIEWVSTCKSRWPL